VSETIPPAWPPTGDMPDNEPDRPDGGETSTAIAEIGDRLERSRLVRLGLMIAILAAVAVWSIWLFIGILALVLFIFLHEMGHYLVAKRNGMKVTEFFIGFGPRIWSFRRGETEYGVKAIPAGAYVRIIGMSNLEEVAPEDEARSYRAQTFGKRMPVVLAGPAVNIALGFLLLVVVFVGFGRPTTDSWTVGSVNADSGAAAAGIRENDRIVAFGGDRISDFEQFRDMVKGASGTTVDVTIERDGSEMVLPVTIGWALTADGAASLPGLDAGDQVTAVNGRPVATYDDLISAMGASGSLDVAFTRGTERFTATMDGPIDVSPDGYKGLVGVGQQPVLVTERAGVVEATGLAATTFGETVGQSVNGIVRLFSPSGIGRLASQVANASDDHPDVAGNVHVVEQPSQGAAAGSDAGSGSSSVDADRPSSIIGIVDLLRQFGEESGWGAVLYLLAVVNIFLGLINLLPLLPFDGGHIAVACYEEIRTRIAHREYRVDMAKLMPVTYVVLMLFVGLFLATGYMDIVNPVRIN